MGTWLFLFVVLVGVLDHATGKLPSYIKPCKKNDPQMDKCIINAIEVLRPKLVKGIPELDLPSIEPMHFKELSIIQKNLKAIGKNVVVTGGSNFKILQFKSDINKLIFQATLLFPYINVKADYEVDMKILSINLKGKGPLWSNNTDITVQGILKGRKVQREKKTYIELTNLDLKIKWKNYTLRLENLFNGDKALGDAVNQALNENKKEIIEVLRPKIEKLVGETLLNIANKVTLKSTYDELFPPK